MRDGKTSILIKQLIWQVRQGKRHIAVVYFDTLPTTIFCALEELPEVRGAGAHEIYFTNGSSVHFVASNDTEKLRGNFDMWSRLN